MRSLTRVLIAAGALLAGSTSGNAATVTYDFQGQFDATLTQGSDSMLQALAGLTFAGSFTYDSATPDSFVAGEPTFGQYLQLGKLFTLHTAVMDLSFELRVIETTNDNGSPPLDVLGVETDKDAGDHMALISLRDAAGLALSSDALPTPFPALSAFSTRRFTLLHVVPLPGGQVDIGAELRGTLVPPQVAVPEPAGGALLAAGLLGFAALRRRGGRAAPGQVACADGDTRDVAESGRRAVA